MSVRFIRRGSILPRPKLPANINVSDIVLQPAAANATLTLTTAGALSPTADKWIVPAVGTGVYSARLVPSSGTLSSGNVNVWETLNVNRSYGVATSAAAKTFNGTLQISSDGGATIITQCPVTLHASTVAP